MKKILVDSNYIKKNIKNNYKKGIMILVGFIVLGVISGAIFTIKYNNEYKSYSFQESTINIKNIKKDVEYYKNVCEKLYFKKEFLKSYLDYYDTIKIREEDKQEFKKIKKRILKYEDKRFNKLNNYYKKETPVIEGYEKACLKKLNDEKKSYLKDNKKIRDKLIELQNIEYNPYYGEEKQEALFNERMSNFEKIKEIENEIKLLENRDVNQNKAINNKFNKMIDDNITEINNIIIDFNKRLEIAANNNDYIIVQNKELYESYKDNLEIGDEIDPKDIANRNKNQAITYAISVESGETRREIFSASFTFIFLVGLAVSIGYIALYEKRRK